MNEADSLCLLVIMQDQCELMRKSLSKSIMNQSNYCQFVVTEDIHGSYMEKGASVQYYLSKIVDLKFDQAVEAVTNALKAEGFGVLTEIDVQAKFKEKLDTDFRKYLILGACDPKSAFKALQADDKVGVLLPCNVIVQETADGKVELSAMDPSAMMEHIGNQALSLIAREVRERLQAVIDKV